MTRENVRSLEGMNTAQAIDGQLPAVKLHVAGLDLDFAQQTVTRRSYRIKLGVVECLVLKTLMEAAPGLLNQTEIVARIWGPDYHGGQERVRGVIGRLRRKLGAGSIETIGREGYRLVC